MMRTPLILAAALFAALALLYVFDQPQPAPEQPPLPRIAQAPEFRLISQDNRPVALSDFRGKVIAVAFIFTRCTETCPVLTPMMSFVQDRLGQDFGKKILFITITVDPERDSPEVLKEYADSFGADPAGWFFLTGPADDIRKVTRSYGVFAAKAENGNIDHTFLTSIIDRQGILRVQYLGVRFDPEEFRRDLLSLTKGP
jgi:protein SCO1/2